MKTKLTKEELWKYAQEVLEGQREITYEDVRDAYGLDDSFMWSAKTFAPYLDSYLSRQDHAAAQWAFRKAARELLTSRPCCGRCRVCLAKDAYIASVSPTVQTAFLAFLKGKDIHEPDFAQAVKKWGMRLVYSLEDKEAQA